MDGLWWVQCKMADSEKQLWINNVVFLWQISFRLGLLKDMTRDYRPGADGHFMPVFLQWGQVVVPKGMTCTQLGHLSGVEDQLIPVALQCGHVDAPTSMSSRHSGHVPRRLPSLGAFETCCGAKFCMTFNWSSRRLFARRWYIRERSRVVVGRIAPPVTNHPIALKIPINDQNGYGSKK